MAADASGAARVGKYLMLHTLGEGAFGKVRLAVDQTTGLEYAIKIMDKSHIKANELTVQVRREIAVMKAMTHPNIVNLHAVLTSSHNLYMVMDLVTGGELFDAVAAQGRLPEPLARSYFQQLVDGIHYCHSRRVYHRDLKPENLLLTADKKTIKITDFGLSSIKTENAASELLHTIMGSPHYIAPEIITSAERGYDGAKVDVWASGVILFGMLAGYLPFDEPATRALYRAIVHNPVTFPPHFSYDCIKLLRAMLQKDPSQRPNMEQVKTFQWFKVDYHPAVVEDPKETTVDASHRKKLKYRTKRSERNRLSKKKDPNSNLPGRREHRRSIDISPDVMSSSEERAHSASNQFHTRSSIAVELRTNSLERAYETKQSSADSALYQTEKENRDPAASFDSGKQDASVNTRLFANRQPLMPLTSHANQSHSRTQSANAAETFHVSAQPSALYDVDDHFDKLDHTASHGEDEVVAQLSETASHNEGEESALPHLCCLRSMGSDATGEQSLKTSQATESCDLSNHSSSKTMPTSARPETKSIDGSSSGFEELLKSSDSRNAPSESHTQALDQVHVENSNCPWSCVPEPEQGSDRGEKASSPPPRIADDAENGFSSREQLEDLKSTLEQDVETRTPGSQKLDLKGRLSDDIFEPGSAQSFISPVSWNPSTMNMSDCYAKSPTASRGLKFALNNIDSPLSLGGLLSKSSAQSTGNSTPGTDTSIFKPIKPTFEKLATTQTPKPSNHKAVAPSVFSPQVDEDVDQKGDWSIDSVSVFADAETDIVSDAVTPASEASVNSSNSKWKFKRVFGRAVNMNEDSRKTIFAPLRLNIADKFSPSKT